MQQYIDVATGLSSAYLSLDLTLSHKTLPPQILFNVDSGLASIVLNRPEKLNALTRDLMLEFGNIVKECADRPDIKVVSITGAGRAFCAGQDLSERDPRKLDWPLDLEAIQRELFHPIIAGLSEMPKPVLVCVNGIAAGAGSSIALTGDIVVAGMSASFAQSFVKVGLSVDAGGGRVLTQALGVARTKAALMLGENISAKDAAEMGLIYKCVPDDELKQLHSTLSQKLLRMPLSALASIKKAVAAASEAKNLNGYLLTEANLQGQAGVHANYREGVLAFLEKRRPKFE